MVGMILFLSHSPQHMGNGLNLWIFEFFVFFPYIIKFSWECIGRNCHNHFFKFLNSAVRVKAILIKLIQQ